MRSLLITLTTGAVALLLSGCPDIPVPVPQSETPVPHDRPAHAGGGHHVVSEIAWFQGTIDEAFSHRGCAESHSRRTLFRF